MTDERTEGGPTESRIREIVREELRSAGGVSRRQLLASIGGGGLAGVATASLAGGGEGSNTAGGAPPDAPGNDQPDGSWGPSVANDGRTVADEVQAFDFGENLDAAGVGERVTVEGRRGVDVAAPDGTTRAASRIEVGPGLDVSVEDGTARITRPRNRFEDGAYLGRPSDLQSALDDAAEDAVGRVRLAAGAVYERNESIRVPASVVLDCSGARIDLADDVNCFELHARSRVRHPHVRTSGVDGYSSSVFHVYPEQFGDQYGAPMPVWTVFGGWSEMTPDEGTCIELHGSESHPTDEYDPATEWNIYFCNVAHNCSGGRRYAYLHREGRSPDLGGHVNGNVVQGFVHNATRFVETDDDAGAADNLVNGNTFHLAVQPHANSEWLWYANKGKHNVVSIWGQHWDYHRYGDADGDGWPDWWYIGENASMNFLWRMREAWPPGLGASVVDDSDGDSGSRYLVHERLGVPVDRMDE